MEFRNLKTFIAVAKQLSFYKAAERLNYAQSSVSAQIQSLEEDLGVKLFDRLGRRILLTEAGEQFMQYAEKMVSLAAESRAAMDQPRHLKGKLTIRIPESFGVYHLPAILKQFRAKHPNVHLRFITCTHDKLAKDLRRGITDLAFLLTDSIAASDLDIEKLGIEPLVLAAQPGHPLTRQTKMPTSALGNETLLLSRVDCSYRRILEKILSEGKIAVKKSLELNSVAAIKACVRRGLGITIVPRIAVEEELAQGKLTAIDWVEDPLEAALLMIWYKEKWLSPTLKAFINECRNVLKTA